MIQSLNSCYKWLAEQKTIFVWNFPDSPWHQSVESGLYLGQKFMSE